MIIAPLMCPIMATAAGLVMGDWKLVWISLLIVGVSVVGTIGLSWLLTEVRVTRVISFQTNTQIAGRIAPMLLDLFVALAAGAPGAFALSRNDVADSLPGVAIAVSLVPPLCSVGGALAQSNLDAVLSAVPVFATNFLAILLAGGGVFTLLGLNRAATGELKPHARRRAFILIAILVVLITIPLGSTSVNLFEEYLVGRTAIQLAHLSTRETGYEVNRIDIRDDKITLVIHGSSDRPDFAEFGRQLVDSLGRPIDVNLLVVPSEQERYSASVD